MKKSILRIFIILSTSALFIQCQPISDRPFGRGGDNLDQGDNAPGGNGDIVVIPNTKTASVIRSERALNTFVSCLGTRTPSSTAKQVWNDNKGSLSAEGSANSITSPMLLAMAKISAEVCNDLIQKEVALAADQRRIFPDIDFNQGPQSISSAALDGTIRRLARSCWGRNETANEKQMLTASLTEAFGTANNNAQQTRNEMIYLCTAMTSSFSTFEM